MAKHKRGNSQGSLFKRTPKGVWKASYYTQGKRREVSTGTTDRAAAERILSKLVADEALIKTGIVNREQVKIKDEGRKGLDIHLSDYLANCEHIGLAEKHISEKKRVLNRMIGEIDADNLSQLTTDNISRYLERLKMDGRSARTVNFHRQQMGAFLEWSIKRGRLAVNSVKHLPKLDESRDRRKIRRPLSEDELAYLLAEAERRGRLLWYLLAVRQGLRRGDLIRLRRGDIDLEQRTLTIFGGKAKRIDVLPLHPQVVEELKKRPAAMPTAKVFTTAVTNITFNKDLDRARSVWIDEAQTPQERQKRLESDFLRKVDAEGRIIDLHSLRTTLGTQLARQGVAPQIAQKILRHGDYRTTLKHYTILGLTDTAAAMNALPEIKRASTKATGTENT